ncbi:MAG: hypothetical protein HETSPECPRED_007080 [Heterodermia speciosa]|uniref:Uncharacterized protein n=1 Tax=Heterodermia speciosa TaxID=116794 RepID=A0A8H3EIB0_9LECA|nr:MAG: hypothetical protein HETSPECPRED_007080 [Heterodermia speciosa]
MLPTWILIVPALISRLNAVPIFEDLYAEDLKASQPFPRTFSTMETRSTSSPGDNSTDSGLQAWPRGRYRLPLHDNFFLVISASPYTRASAPLSRRVRDFIVEFADNIESECPPPGLSPQQAAQAYYDTDSFTKFEIVESVPGIIASPAPTAILISALNSIAVQIRNFGPPQSLTSSICQRRTGLIRVKYFNIITLDIFQLESNDTGMITLDRRIASLGASKVNFKR